MSISQVARAIAESPTLKLNEKAKRLKDKGEAVVHLGGGEPKNKTPINAILSSAAKLNSGEIKYAPSDGIPSLKKAIIRYTEDNYGRAVSPDNVIVSSGAKQAVYNLLYSLVNPQDEVIILAPYWVSYPEMIKMVYGVPVVVTPEDGSFQPAIQEVEEVIGSYTKAIIINSPNNPSGKMYSTDFIQAVVELCEKKGIYAIFDDIYHKLIFDGKQWPSPYQFTKKNIESSRVVTINGISKLYGMTGYRIGWCVAPKDIIETMTNVQAQTESCASVLLQAAAEGALMGPRSPIEALRLTLQNNRDVMVQELKSFEGVRFTKPDGTYYCFADFRAYDKDSVKLSKFLLEKALVVTVPGKDFGMEGFLRLSYSTTVKAVTEGVQRIKWALDPNSPNEIYIGERKLLRDWK